MYNILYIQQMALHFAIEKWTVLLPKTEQVYRDKNSTVNGNDEAYEKTKA